MFVRESIRPPPRAMLLPATTSIVMQTSEASNHSTRRPAIIHTQCARAERKPLRRSEV
ncbi:hypothetical protein BJX63DRAFT_182529 [Aspergillus granulosus]|uniref:Uncharacterized protein n=1 Tax=Aspergillus granulosus TaxID=176169 RepID=A0ABR4I2W9_9EURO